VTAYAGHLQLSEHFTWLGSLPALTMLAVAALMEVLAYYVPAVDHLLDAITTPAALIAGTLVAAATMTNLPPLVKWATAVIAGGGAAGITQTVTALLRAKSTVFTAGLGNPYSRRWSSSAPCSCRHWRSLHPLLQLRWWQRSAGLRYGWPAGP